MSRSNDLATTSPTVVSDKANTSTGYLDLPSGTTAQRPTLDNAGGTRFNTTTGSLEFYDGANWVSTNLIPTINSITGNIYATASSTLTLSVTNATDTIDVKYYEGGTLLATDVDRTVSNNSATSTVPSEVYGQTAGDTISIQVVNSDETPSSNNIDKTVLALPSGGAKTTSGNYHIHTFTTSGTFVVPSGLTLSDIEYVVVCGGGGGGYGYYGGGGGAGGYRSSVVGENSGRGTSAESRLTRSTGDYDVVVGGGGGGSTASGTQGDNGDPSSFDTISSLGGGGGGSRTNNDGKNGGSGGGASSSSYSGGDGASGQGYDGADASGTFDYGSGGGGAGEAGYADTNVTSGREGDGGNGVQTSINGTPTYFAGGGAGGGRYNEYGINAQGGLGGGGDGGTLQSNNTEGGGNKQGEDGKGGGGAGAGANVAGGDGGDGIVIIRYQLP